jgi:hypothetical protein
MINTPVPGGTRVHRPTPAMHVLLSALEGTDMHPLVTEPVPGLAPWRVTLTPPLSHLQLGDGHASTDLDGTGPTRDDALYDLLSQITRVTYALRVTDVDLTSGTYQWVSLAWSGDHLAITGHGRAPLQIREVIAA